MSTARLAITAGEPAGIGPDLCLMLAQHPSPCERVIIADPQLLRDRAQQLGLPVELLPFDPDALPKHLHPLCDALGGRCLTPQEAYPGATLWPSLGCAHERRALCAGPQPRSPCQPCVVKNGG